MLQHPAYRTRDTVAISLSFDQICGCQTAPTSIWSTTRYGVSSSSEIVSRRCTTLTNRSSDRWSLGMALTTASLRMQLTSVEVIFDHASGQIMDTWATAVTVLISTKPFAMKCFIFVTHDMMFKLCLLGYSRNSNFWIPKVKQQYD